LKLKSKAEAQPKFFIGQKQKTPTTREVVGGNIETSLGRLVSNCSLREASELAPGFSAIRKKLLSAPISKA